MKKYIIEVEETKAETVVNLLAQIKVKIGKPTEEEFKYVKICGNGYGLDDEFLKLTREQYEMLDFLRDGGFFEDWEEVDPSAMFERI